MAALPYFLIAAQAGQQAINARRQGVYESQRLEQNAGLADDQAADVLARGADSAQRARLAGKGVLGSNKVALASQGIDQTSGTAADLLEETTTVSELDRLAILNNAHRAAWGYKVDAAEMRAGAEQTRKASKSAIRSTLLTAAAQTYARKKGY
jgi:hypothetical protein